MSDDPVQWCLVRLHNHEKSLESLNAEIAALEHPAIEDFLKKKGWVMTYERKDLAVYRRGKFEIAVPRNKEFGDYTRCIKRAVRIIYEIHGGSDGAAE